MRDTRANDPACPRTAPQRRNRPSGQGDDAAARRERGRGDDRASWLKQPGDTVAKYEPLLEVITDKVNAEVPSPFAGVLKEILVEEGATVPNNAEIAVIETDDEAGRPRRRSRARRDRGAAGRDARGNRRASSPPARTRQPRATGPARLRRAPRPRAASAPRRQPRPRRDPAAPAAPAAAAPTAAASRCRRPERPHDPRRPAAAPRARPRGGADRRHRRRRPDHPRGRHRTTSRPQRTGQTPVGSGGRAAAAAAAAAPRRPSAAPGPAAPPHHRAGAATNAAPGIVVPRGRGRGPRPDDPDAQGHRGPDDPRPPASRTPTSRWRSTRRTSSASARRDKKDYQAQGGDRPLVRPVRRQGVRRGAEEATRRSTPTGPRRASSPSGG